MSVLTPAPRLFLAKFFARPAAQSFYFTGGSALSEYYLQHRLSQDLDLFTQDKVAWTNIEADLKTAAAECGFQLEFVPARGLHELHRAFLKVPDEPDLKLDLVHDSPPRLGEAQAQPNGVLVDALENIATGKLLALCGRAYPRDFVDVYFLRARVRFWRVVGARQNQRPGRA
jgi:predicted nucleotidyltransferase component of viral defense system